jgi:hypothetical protein
MYPKLKIQIEGKEPIEVETLPVDFMMYEELQGTKVPSEQGLRLTIAYYYVEGKEPLNLNQVKTWARLTRCTVEIMSETVNPTQTEATTD